MTSVPPDDDERTRRIGELLDSPEGERLARALIAVLRGIPPEQRAECAERDQREAERW